MTVMESLPLKLTYRERARMRKELCEWGKQSKWTYTVDYYTDREYIECVADIFEHPAFQSMAKFIQHGDTSTREHCIQVSYLCYTLGKMFHVDARTCARAGLLHDMFLYDWHTYHKECFLPHGFTHARVALKNADSYFELNEVERNSILRHMFPLTPIPPRYAEGLILVYADKYVSTYEVLKDIKVVGLRTGSLLKSLILHRA